MALPLDGLRVLVVEDRSDLRDLFAILLRVDGAQAAKAETGREALARVQARSFHAVLCDLGLPDVHGALLIRQLVNCSRTPPIIAVITGYEEPHVSRARAAGAHAVFRKPVEWEQIVAFLRCFRPPRPEVVGVAA